MVLLLVFAISKMLSCSLLCLQGIDIGISPFSVWLLSTCPFRFLLYFSYARKLDCSKIPIGSFDLWLLVGCGQWNPAEGFWREAVKVLSLCIPLSAVINSDCIYDPLTDCSTCMIHDHFFLHPFRSRNGNTLLGNQCPL